MFFICTSNNNRNFRIILTFLWGADSLLKPVKQTALLAVVAGTSFTMSAKHIIVNSFPPLPHLWQEAGIAAKD